MLSRSANRGPGNKRRSSGELPEQPSRQSVSRRRAGGVEYDTSVTGADSGVVPHNPAVLGAVGLVEPRSRRSRRCSGVSMVLSGPVEPQIDGHIGEVGVVTTRPWRAVEPGLTLRSMHCLVRCRFRCLFTRLHPRYGLVVERGSDGSNSLGASRSCRQPCLLAIRGDMVVRRRPQRRHGRCDISLHRNRRTPLR